MHEMPQRHLVAENENALADDEWQQRSFVCLHLLPCIRIPDLDFSTFLFHQRDTLRATYSKPVASFDHEKKYHRFGSSNSHRQLAWHTFRREGDLSKELAVVVVSSLGLGWKEGSSRGFGPTEQVWRQPQQQQLQRSQQGWRKRHIAIQEDGRRCEGENNWIEGSRRQGF